MLNFILRYIDRLDPNPEPYQFFLLVQKVLFKMFTACLHANCATLHLPTCSCSCAHSIHKPLKTCLQS
ncbi:hypothetical protein AQUCO_00500125v1 [Aquilegia coerulea]|uniref:Uncharacterized protein n=1 Tax=Aquilegia coerulea TaxID=218851 RepID=A0A2G5EQH0_AQUCA|nr:hypothetical protein AQUCO_00500125v1 [Aquilegia coerulea]